MYIEKGKEGQELTDWICTSIQAYLKTLTHHLFYSRIYIAKLLDVISRCSQLAPKNEIVDTFKKWFEGTQVWVWIFWIPKLLNLMLKSEAEFEISKIILTELARLYPQTLFVELRMFYWYFGSKGNRRNEPRKYSFLTEKRINTIGSTGRSLYELFKEQNFNISFTDTIDFMIREMKKFATSAREEELYSIIEKGYELSFTDDFDPYKYCEKISKGFFNEDPKVPEFMDKTLKNQFNLDFMNISDEENKYLQIQEKFKKWKDMLSRRLSLKMTPSTLVEISGNLANFSYKSGIELPGQYLEIDIEPFPEKRILITKFEPTLFVGGVNKKRIIIRTNTGKRMMYSILNNVRIYENSTKTDERINHFKVFMNKIFTNINTETMRRGVRFGVFKKIVFPYTKLYEENNLNSMDEIYKIA